MSRADSDELRIIVVSCGYVKVQAGVCLANV
jgi:hypothetical protein